MEVTEQCVVALTWILKDTLGEELDILTEPVEFVVGGDDLLKRVEEALQGHTVGQSPDLHLEPEEAFGDYDENLIFLEPRDLFPVEIEEGMSFEASALPQGTSKVPEDLLYTIAEIYPIAHWQEREIHEFFGIVFIGHPYLIPLLLPEDAEYHPLLKDYSA